MRSITTICRYVLLSVALLITHQIQATVKGSYRFSKTVQPYVSLPGGTILGTAANTFGSRFENLPIGFTFYFDGLAHDSVTVLTSGNLMFDYDLNFPIVNFTGQLNPLRTDLRGKGVGTASRLSYQTIGTAPNRVFVVEWFDYHHEKPLPLFPNETINFQVRLYENDHRIEYHYGTFVLGGNVGGATVSIGNPFDNINISTPTTTSWVGANDSTIGDPKLNTTSAPVPGELFRFDPLIDAGLTQWQSPGPGYCFTNQETLAVQFTNNTPYPLRLAQRPVTLSLSVQRPNGPVQNFSVMLDTGILEAAEARTVMFSSQFNMAATGQYVFTASLQMAGDTVSGNNALIMMARHGLPLQSAAQPASICLGSAARLSASPVVTNPLEALKITEVQIDRYKKGAQAYFPNYISLPLTRNLIEVSNTGDQTVDVTGVSVVAYMNNNPAIVTATMSFPAGTLIPPGKTAVFVPANLTDDPVHLLFSDPNGSTTQGADFFSSRPGGVVLRSGSDILDAVTWKSFSFPASAGVTPADFSSPVASATFSSAGIRRIASIDTNTGQDWVYASKTRTLNIGYYEAYLEVISIGQMSWQPGNLTGAEVSVSPQQTTTYTGTFTANAGCSATTSVTVVVTPAPAQPAVAGSTTVCAGQPVNLTASGSGTDGRYTWRLSPTGPAISTAATYTISSSTASFVAYVQATDTLSGCTSSFDTVAVTVTAIPIPPVTMIPQSSGNYQLNGQVPAGPYTFYWQGPGITDSTLLTQLVSPLQTSSFTFTITDTLTGCTRSNTVTVTVLGIENELSESSLQVWPNPGKGLFNVKLPEFAIVATLQIWDARGVMVKQQTLQNGTLDLRRNAAGLYLLRVQAGGKIYQQRLRVE